jgi:ATP phosphoribosyltransferase
MNNLENAEIAIQKGGRLTEDSLRWINEVGNADFPVCEDPFDRTRQITDSSTGITITGYSNGDILKAVACGYADWGIAGEDKLDELVWPQRSGDPMDREGRQGFNRFANLTNSGWMRDAKPFRLVVAKNQETSGFMNRVATSYPNLTRQWAKGRFRPTELSVFSGGVEAIARMAGFDTVVDIARSGDTLRENGFKEVETIREFRPVAIRRWRDPITPQLFDVLKNPSILDLVSARLEDRKYNPNSSLASRLVRDGDQAIRKLSEESTELIVELAKGTDIDAIKLEAADLIFSVCAAMVERGASIAQVQVELAGRYQGQDLQMMFGKGKEGI